MRQNKKSSRWVNYNFQSQAECRLAKHFAYNFTTNNKGDVLNFTLKLVDTSNKIIKFTDSGKKFPIINFMIEFLGSMADDNINDRIAKFSAQLQNKFFYRIPLPYLCDLGKINFPTKIDMKIRCTLETDIKKLIESKSSH